MADARAHPACSSLHVGTPECDGGEGDGGEGEAAAVPAEQQPHKEGCQVLNLSFPALSHEWKVLVKVRA